MLNMVYDAHVYSYRVSAELYMTIELKRVSEGIQYIKQIDIYNRNCHQKKSSTSFSGLFRKDP